MAEFAFVAPEYQADQSIVAVGYHYRGSSETGWLIRRDGHDWLELGPGYVPVRSRYCGVCSTDLARHLLPFPLPQVIGHEMVGEYQGERVAVEINASHAALGRDNHDCAYCRAGLDSHCPERLTLGIDRLPGGFAPWVLAPIKAIHRLPVTLDSEAAVLIEPFAAAVKAVEVTPPTAGEQIAVLGPRRLGMLLIAALDAHRRLQNKPFEIVAVMRHPRLQDHALRLGADRVVLLAEDSPAALHRQFDVVFDTTGSPAGFELALGMARRVVHLKSTHGRSVLGFEHVTALVINEQSLLPFRPDTLARALSQGPLSGPRRRAYISPTRLGHPALQGLGDSNEIISQLDSLRTNASPLDWAVVTSMAELNRLTRPITPQGQGWLRAGGMVLLANEEGEGLIGRLNQVGLGLATSRCGSFATALDILRRLPELAQTMRDCLVSQVMPVQQLAEAMRLAGESERSIKVVVKTDT